MTFFACGLDEAREPVRCKLRMTRNAGFIEFVKIEVHYIGILLFGRMSQHSSRLMEGFVHLNKAWRQDPM